MISQRQFQTLSTQLGMCVMCYLSIESRAAHDRVTPACFNMEGTCMRLLPPPPTRDVLLVPPPATPRLIQARHRCIICVMLIRGWWVILRATIVTSFRHVL